MAGLEPAREDRGLKSRVHQIGYEYVNTGHIICPNKAVRKWRRLLKVAGYFNCFKVLKVLNSPVNDFQSRAVAAFNALADPTRYKIVCLLTEKGELGCSDFNNQFALSKSALSHHYRILENAGLILMRKEGSHIYTRLNHSVLDEFIPGFARTHLNADNLAVE